MEIHILIDQVQKVVSIGSGRISEINHRNIVSIPLSDVSVVAHDVALGIGRQERHAGGAGIFDTGIQPKCGFADASRSDH